MLKRIKCWLIGHDWKQCGANRINHIIKNIDGIEMESCHRDHFLYCCKRCAKIKEYHCQVHYNTISHPENEHAEVE